MNLNRYLSRIHGKKQLLSCSVCHELPKHFQRLVSSKSAVVIGCYKSDDGSSYCLTDNGKQIDGKIGGKLNNLLTISNFKADVGKTRTFFGLHQDYPCVAVTGLGESTATPDANEERDESRENVRIAVGAAAKNVQSQDFKSVHIDSCGQPLAAAEGALLSLRQYDEYKSKKEDPVEVKLLNVGSSSPEDIINWNSGTIFAEAQNFASGLMEMPSNYKPPTVLAEIVRDKFASLSDVDVIVRDKDWATTMKMDCFLSVAKGSHQEPAFVEIHYKGSQQTPLVLVGKGVTFDTGGISIKPSNGMGLMRGDMGGAACVLGTLYAIAKLRLPINLVVLTPLVENMPSGRATKPGDVFTAMNGKTVEVDNTDAEGRLILADALSYACQFQPSHIIDVATLTGAIDVALGAAAAGTYTTSNALWNTLQQASMKSGDRLWRMPLYKYYSKQMDCSKTADLRNTQKKAGSAGSPTAAAFLKEFVDTEHWAHLDIAGVMTNEGDVPYLKAGMSGRPTRTLIEAVRMLAAQK